MALNNAQSIVDFLRTRGFQPGQGDKFPLFNQRKKLFEDLGLNKQLGEFRGSEIQNPALLNALASAERTAGVSINPSNIMSILRTSQIPSATIPPTAPESAAAGQISGVPADLQGLVERATTFNQPNPEALAQQALERVQGRATFPLQQEAVQAEKEQLQLQAQAKKEKLLSSLASRGLFFSGKKETGLKAIDAEELAKEFGIDRKFALLITQGLETAAQQIAKEAVRGDELQQKQARETLSALGFVVTPEGRLVQKPAEARAERGFELREEAAARAREALDIKKKKGAQPTTKKVTQADKKSQFIQYIGQLPQGTKSKEDVEREAVQAGINPQDKSVQQALITMKGSLKAKPSFFSSVRKYIGF